jgi:hypothetical protein
MLQTRGSRPDENIDFFFFLVYLALPAVLCPGVYSASDINEYQKQEKSFSGVNHGWRVRLVTSGSGSDASARDTCSDVYSYKKSSARGSVYG